MTRLAKLDRMTPEQKAAEIDRFWNAGEDVNFPPETIAIVFDVSPSWLQQKRTNGGGIPFSRLSARKIRYLKSDIIEFFNQRKVENTSMKSGL